LAATSLTRSPVPSLALISAALAAFTPSSRPSGPCPPLPEPLNGCGFDCSHQLDWQPRGFAGPYSARVIKSATGDPLSGLLFLSALLFVPFCSPSSGDLR